MLKCKILFVASVFVFFQLSSCMRGGVIQEEAVTETFWDEKEARKPLLMAQRTVPVSIVGGTANQDLFAKVPNIIQVNIEGASTEHLHVFASNGPLVPIDVSKGLYSYTEERAGAAVEIVAKDTITGKIISEVFNMIEVPAPDAYVWTIRTIFKNQLEFGADQFKLQNGIILQHNNIQVSILCAASSYTIVRINEAGKRSVHKNKNATGMFDEEGKKIIAAAKKGDIYIFKDIKANCTPSKVKNIVYTIK